MSVALEAIDGVDSVTVSLNEGLAVITFAPEHQVTIAQIRRVVLDNGFSPKEAEVRLVGRVDDAGDGVTATPPGQAAIYRLREHPESAGVLQRMRSAGLDRSFVVEGVIPESSDDDGPPVILVRRFTE